MDYDDVPRCDADRAFCRSCPERCHGDEPETGPDRPLVRWVSDMVSAGDAWLRRCVFPAVSKFCSDLNEVRKR